MRELRLVALAIAAAGALLAAVFLLSRLIGAGAPPAAPIASEQKAPEGNARRAQVEGVIAATPEVATYFDQLRAVLPADYEAAIHKAMETPAGSSTDTPDFWLSDAVKIVRQSHGALAAKADGGPLAQIFDKQAAVLTALQGRDARLCVDFLYGGASEGFFAFAAENRALVTDLARAGLDATADGLNKKINRDPPTDADFQLLEDALKTKGLNDVEITALLDGKAPEPPLPDTRLCEMGRLYLDALASLPEETRLRLYALAAGLMARS